MTYSYELFLDQLGAWIKKLRKERGWTLRDMVVNHNFHLSQWQALEAGNRRGVSIPTLLKVAEILSVPPWELIRDLGEVRRDDGTMM